jgi:Cu2+-exporting ATPase
MLSGRGLALARAGALETLAGATDVIFDKTGTLTEGRFTIVETRLLGPAEEPECFALARALETGSRHPLARAFGPDEGEARASGLREFAGRGVEGEAGGRRVRIGTREFCRELTPLGAPAVEGGACTRVYLADERGFLAAFALQDRLREGSAAAVRALRAAGIRVHLLSGDHPEAVQGVARELGVGLWAGGMSPEDKFAYVERLQAEGRVVAMAGDGLNDAPVLARADVSFAMAGGADAAQRGADLVVLGGSPAAVADAIDLARRTMRIVRQNLAWAAAYNAVAVPLAAAGWIGPWEAAVGMAASSFIVVLNALRLEQAADRKPSWKASTSSSLSPSRSYS